jgi:hypothetical protein
MHNLKFADQTAPSGLIRTTAKQIGGIAKRGTGALYVVAADLLRSGLPRSMRYPVPELSEHAYVARNSSRIQLCVDWLCESQDWTSDDGSSKGHHLVKGPMASYPETTGYAIPSLYDAAEILQQPDIGNRCERMANWLVSIQLSNGAFQGGAVDRPAVPIVFNTGQIIFGLLRAHAETNNPQYLNAARRAGEFLQECQDSDGAWRKYDYLDLPHVYSVRVAWSLLLLTRATGEPSFAHTAVANLEWALRQQQPNGWYANNHFKPGELPNTHGIAYVTQSLVESSVLTGDSRYLESAKVVADRLLRRFEMSGRIQGVHSSDWKSPKSHTCVTGNIQMAITWLRLHQIQGDIQYLNAALRVVDQVCAIQKTVGPAGIRGGIPGSVPTWGSYAPLQYPNWAVKFWLDLLVLTESVMTQHELEDSQSAALADHCAQSPSQALVSLSPLAGQHEHSKQHAFTSEQGSFKDVGSGFKKLLASHDRYNG